MDERHILAVLADSDDRLGQAVDLLQRTDDVLAVPEWAQEPAEARQAVQQAAEHARRARALLQAVREGKEPHPRG